ncbi:MAG: hypothetical protein ACYCYP_04675 [Leptospirales bacterium]
MFSEIPRTPGCIRFCLTLLLGLGVSGCFGSTPIPSVPSFLIVVNNSLSTGLVEYSLPLATGSVPLISLDAAGTYEGGVTVQNDLFIFGKDSGNAPALWRYTLPLSQSPSPMQLTGFQGTPVAALALAGGQYVVFLEKTASNQACLEGFTAGGLISTGSSALPAPSLTCSSSTFSLPGSFIGGTMQLSGNGSTLLIETTYLSGENQTTIQAFPAGSIMNSPFPPANGTHPLSGTLSTFPVEGAAESNNVLLLLPDPSIPAVDFYKMTSIQTGTGNLSPLPPNSLSNIPLFPLLALDPFGSFVYMATTKGGGSSPTIYSFSLNSVQNSSNAVPFAQVGTGLNPVALLTVVGSQG